MRSSILLLGLVSISLILPAQSYNHSFDEAEILASWVSSSSMQPLFFDVDGDGDQDLLRSQSSSNRLTYIERLTNNTFGQEHILFENLTSLIRVESYDIDANGLLDLFLLANGTGTLYYSLQMAQGEYSPPTAVTSNLSSPKDFVIADIDGDGLPEAYCLDYNNGRIVSFAWTADGGFLPNENIISNTPFPYSIESMEIGNPASQILISTHKGNNGIFVHSLNNDIWSNEQVATADPLQQVQSFGNNGFLSATASSISYFSLTDDNWQSETLLASSQVGSIQTFQYIETDSSLIVANSSKELSVWSAENQTYVQSEVILYDQLITHLTIDTLSSHIALMSSADGAVQFGSNPFETTQITTTSLNSPKKCLFFQWDSDPEKEIIVTNGNSLIVYDIGDYGLWDKGIIILSDIEISSFDVADVNDDGIDDILFCSSSIDKLAWIPSLGPEEYGTEITISFIMDGPSDCVWVDGDSDGYIDAAVVNSVGRDAYVHFNDGSSFTSSVAIIENGENIDGTINNDQFKYIEFADTDEDGTIEFMLNATSDRWYIQKPAAGYTHYYTIDVERPNCCGARVNLIDLEGDGYEDVCWNGNGRPFSIQLNTNGSFSAPLVSLGGLYPNIHSLSGSSYSWYTKSFRSVPSGPQELFIAYKGASTVGIYATSTNTLNTPHATNIISNYGNRGEITFFNFSDYDLDGDIDIVAVNPSQDEVILIPNLGSINGCTDSSAVNYDATAIISNEECNYLGEECDDGISSTYNDVFLIDGQCSGQSFNGESILRINCGYTSDVVADSEGNHWQTEEFAVGGGNTGGGAVNGTFDDAIFGRVRYGTTGYDLPVPDGGNYLVRLHFAAMRNEVQTEGYEVFHVLLEGDTMESHFDIYAEAGGRQKYIAREYFIETTDDVISLRMPVVSFSNEISGIEVFQYTGDCEDLDLDDVCDDLEVFGCTEADACNYDDDATEDDGTCEFVSCAGCTDVEACNFDAEATYLDASCEYAEVGYDCAGVCLEDMDADGVCDDFEIEGCTYPGASNYMPIATDDDGSCLFDGAPAALGCTYPEACNFDPAAGFDDGSCVYPLLGRDCDGICLNDQDGDGICDEFEGCTIPTACNYNAAALDNDGCCIFAEDGADCDGNCVNDIDGDGICDEAELPGCTDPLACNYSQLATDDNGTCFFAADGQDCDGNCLSDLDGDGVCDGDEVEGCADEAACNYDAAVTNPDGSCTYPDFYYDCAGNCLADADGDGVCDLLEISGCTYAGAANFSPSATNDDGSCVFGGDAVGGCFYSSACNYDAAATVDDGSCIFPTEGLDCNGECLLDCDGDGICDANEIPGCTDAAACNYLPGATDDLDNCEYLSCAGCMDSGACNYDASAPYEDGSCEYLSCAGCTTAEACNFDATASIEDGSCEFESCVGCTYPEADNYDPTATIDDGSCITTGQLQAVADTAYNNGYVAGVEITELECEEEVTDAYNEGFTQGVNFGCTDNGGPSQSACGPGTVWSDLYQLCLPEEVCTGDINEDGNVGVNDILVLLTLFGTYCN